MIDSVVILFFSVILVFVISVILGYYYFGLFQVISSNFEVYRYLYVPCKKAQYCFENGSSLALVA